MARSCKLRRLRGWSFSLIWSSRCLFLHLFIHYQFISFLPLDLDDQLSYAQVTDAGMPIHNYPFEHGSLYVKFQVVFPTTLTAESVDQLKTCLPELLPQIQGEKVSFPILFSFSLAFFLPSHFCWVVFMTLTLRFSCSLSITHVQISVSITSHVTMLTPRTKRTDTKEVACSALSSNLREG